MKSQSSATVTETARPFWIPADVDFDSISVELKEIISAVIDPAYRQLVLEASPGLEQSTGLTIVHLLWLEVLDQLQLGGEPTHDIMHSGESSEREKKIAAHLRLIGAKSKMSGFLLRLHEFRQRAGEFPGFRDPFRASSGPFDV